MPQHKRKSRTHKKTKRTNKKKKSPLYIINIILAFIVITLTASIVAYFVFFNESKDKKAQTLKISKKKIINEKDEDYVIYRRERLDKYFEEDTEELEKEYVYNKKTKQALKRQDESKKIKKIKEIKEIKEIKQKKKQIEPDDKLVNKIDKIAKQLLKPLDDRPKLSIIIDDVTLKSQVISAKNIGYPVNMSFLPPTSRHKNSAKITDNLDNYMIHLPLQAGSFKFEEQNTLHIGDSTAKIDNRIAKLKLLYPNARYTNNHTGSKFTADKNSMDKLMRVLKKYDFKFLDSRTTSKTVAKEYALKYKVPFLSRNIFLDNKQEFSYVQNQLKKAIQIAKRDGFAIAIGHPHKITFKVLKESKDLLRDLNIVLIDKLPTL